MALDTARTVATLRGLTAKFDNAVKGATPFYPTLCTTVPSRGADEDYGFLGSMPGVREWLGDRVFNSLRGARYSLVNKKWESSILIEKDDIDDDRLGMYNLSFSQLGVEAAHHPDELLFDIVTGGESAECFDGQNFFDTDHLWGDSGSQSNDLTYNAADPNAVTEAEFRAAYEQAATTMIQYKRDNGKPMNRPTFSPNNGLVLVLPPQLREVASKALLKEFINSGESNVVMDKPSRIITIPYLTSGVKFYLFDTSKPLKPFVFQARKPLARQMKGMDDREFKDVKMMTDARYNVGYLAWWNAVLTTFN